MTQGNHEKENGRLAEIGRLRIDKGRDSALETIAKIAMTAIGTKYAAVSIVLGDHAIAKAYTSDPEMDTDEVYKGTTERVESFCANCIVNNESDHLIINDALESDYRCLNVVTGGIYRFYVGCQLKSVMGHIIGTICLLHDKPKTITPQQINVMRSLSRQVMEHLESRVINIQLKLTLNEVKKKNKELQMLSEEKHKFLGMVNHYIRQPLCSVQVSSELLELEVKKIKNPRPEVIDLVQGISSSTEFMNYLMDNLLHITHPDSKFGQEIDKTTLKLKVLDPLLLIRRIVLSNSKIATNKQIEISLEIHEDLTENGSQYLVNMDAFRIEQVLNNLISNAIKFSLPETKTIVSVKKKKMSESAGNDHIEVSVTDQGLGISEDELGNLFDEDKSITTRPTGNESTTGLGLSIVKRIIEFHNGGLYCVSTKDKGSTFSFTLPIAQVKELNKINLKSSRSMNNSNSRIQFNSSHNLTNNNTTTNTNTNNTNNNNTTNNNNSNDTAKNLSILVAEDNPLNQKLIYTILNNNGHRVTLVNNGEEAVSLYKKSIDTTNTANTDISTNFHLVLLDNEMPVMNGLEAASIIRKIDNDVAIVMVSGSILADDGSLNTYDGVLLKPFKVNQLLDTVKNSYLKKLK